MEKVFLRPCQGTIELIQESRIRPREQGPGKGAKKGRGHEGSHDQSPNRALQGQIGAGHEPPEERPDAESDKTDPEGYNDRIPDRLEEGFFGKDIEIVPKRNPMLVAQAGYENRAQGQDHEKDQKQRGPDPHRQGWIKPPQTEAAGLSNSLGNGCSRNGHLILLTLTRPRNR